MSVIPPASGRAAERARLCRSRVSPPCPPASPVVSLFLLSAQPPYPFRRIRSLPLRAYCRRLRLMRGLEDGRLTATVARLADILETRSQVLASLPPSTSLIAEQLFRLAAYQDKFVRQPEDWTPAPGLDPAAQWRSLVSHLFERWPVPAAFANAWLAPGELCHPAREWYCHLGAGGSLRTLPGLPSLRRSVWEHLHVPLPDIGTMEHVRRAQLASLNGSVEVIRIVMASRMAEDFSNDGVWLPLLEKIIASPSFDYADFGMITEAVSEEIQYGGGSARGRALVRLPLTDLSRWAARWWKAGAVLTRPELVPKEFDPRDAIMRARIRKLLRCRWERFGRIGPWDVCTREDGIPVLRWSIQPVDDLTALRAEGAEMKHCVGGYGRLCHLGYSAIFRVRASFTDGTPSREDDCTVEVSQDRRSVAQVRGRWNRRPTPLAISVLREWARGHDLSWSARAVA